MDRVANVCFGSNADVRSGGSTYWLKGRNVRFDGAVEWTRTTGLLITNGVRYFCINLYQTLAALADWISNVTLSGTNVHQSRDGTNRSQPPIFSSSAVLKENDLKPARACRAKPFSLHLSTGLSRGKYYMSAPIIPPSLGPIALLTPSFTMGFLIALPSTELKLSPRALV